MGKKLLFLVFLTFATFLLSSWNGFGQCTDSVTITSNASDNTICAGTEVIFTATPSNGGSNPLYQWRVNGVNVGANSNLNTYTTTTLQNGQVVSVRLTSDIANCGAGNPVVSNNITISVNPLSTVNPGGAIAAICQGGITAALGGSFGGGATSAVWSDGGVGGSFANNSGSNPSNTIYTASASAPASITLTLTTAGGSCGSVNTTKTLTVNQNPTVNAGGAISVFCQGGTTAALGGTFGGGATSAVWSDGGAGGSFTNNTGSNSGNTTYTSSASAPASITLTLTSAGGQCGTVNTTKILTINPNPTVSVGVAIAAICQGGTTTALGGSFGGGATSAVWSDGGAGGSFTNNTGSNPGNTTYTASALAPASITLTLTTAGGSCMTVNATKNLTINPTPIISAGVAIAAICQGGTTTALGGSFGGGATSAVWSDGGAGGSFSNNSGSNPGNTTYTASTTAPASIILTLTTSGGSCGNVNATKTLTINPTPTVSAGSAIPAICQGGTTTALGGSFGGGATSAIWSANVTGGSFSNNSGNTPNTATYTAAANAPASIILTLTSSGGSCGTVNATKTLNVNSSVVPTVLITASSTSICTTAPSGSTPVTFTATPTNGGTSPTYQWKNGATNVGTNSATYTANSLANGSQISVVMTSNVNCAAPVTATSNIITMTGYTPPAAPVFVAPSGNINITSGVCPEANGLVYTVTPSSNITSYVWVIPSGWNFVSGQGTNSITVDVTVNSAINTNNISVSAVNACGTSSQVTLAVDINKSAGVNAGPDRSMCVGNPPITLNGSQTGYATNVIWSAPSGTFGSPGNPVTTYTPTITSGTVTLTLSSTKKPGNISCPLVSDQMILTIYPVPTAVAGTAVTACSNAAVNITAGSSATNNAGVLWTSNGTGTIANPTSLTTATYTPGANETGPVTLTLTATGNAPCINAISTKTLTITKAPTAVAGTAVTACSNSAVNITSGASASNNTGILWTSNGTGTIANPTSLTTATYTAGNGETGPVTLTLTATGITPCANAVSTKSLTISQAATAVAGTAITTCSNAAINITTASSASNNTGIVWTSNGTGTIANPTSLTTATYTAGNGETGPVTLTLTATGITPCVNAVSTKILTISQAATAVAGTAITTCSNAAINITTGSSATNNADILWTSNGTGTIANPTSLTQATYTPGNGETGPVTLTLTATGITPCANAVSTKTLTISQAATAVAGTAVVACSNAATNITTGSSASNNTGIVWTSNGTGTIANPTSLTAATYTPGNGETGPVTLTLTATGITPCANAVSTKTLTISQAATAVAGTAIIACSNAATNITTGSSASNNTEIVWTSNGTGTIANANSLTTATYTPGNGETGPVTLTLTATGITPCANAVSTKILSINQEVSITTQPIASQTICSGFPVNFSVSATGTGLTYEWFKNDTSLGIITPTLSINQTTLANAGTYKVKIKRTAPCAEVSSEEAFLIVNENITINTQPTNVEDCEGNSNTFLVSASGNISSYEWRKDGIPISDNGNYSGTKTNTLTISNLILTNTGNYDVVISSTDDTCSQTISNPAVLTVTPSVTINAFSPATSTRCQGAGSVTTTTTATNSTGITYSLDAASLTGGNTIVAATGAVTYAAGWSGTTTIT
ncbi:beta strand repeat-containing protein, partial [Gillisia sp. CAL575]|uniref:beta strand repeat-containing protein n=1 Tax=Gillisia sp. CAL575 TaxID=985255 RepID=UPI000558D164